MSKSIRLKVRKGMKKVQDKLSFCTSTVASNSKHVQDLRSMFKDMVSFLESVEVIQKANAEGEKWEKNSLESPVEEKDAQYPDQTKGEQDSGATTVAISSEGKNETDDEPPSKKVKFLIPSSSIPSPTPLKSIMPEPPKYTEAVKMTVAQFTEHLSQITSSIFSHTPPREPTPPRDETKGKGIATEEPLKDTMPFMDEGGSVPKMPKTKSFTTLVGHLSQEEFNAQIKKMKRLANLKAEQDKSEQELKKMFNQATLKTRAQNRLNMRQRNLR
nr:hypothetical protein [Tanacetum cinerariifolium]